ncbi:redoxin domain-containing protein [Pedobacter sp.]|uniref:redoxin domain-containing protein n=1 Tax=Pedobacter sp. TaxID=1411316 RepID=UPI003BAB32CB
MKTKIIALATIPFIVGSLAFQMQQGYKITGKIAGADNQVIYLSHNDGKQEIKDSATIKNGHFSFSGTVKEVQMYVLKLKGLQQQKALILENKAITISGNKDSLFNAKVTGSPETDTYYGFYNGPWKAITAKAGNIYRRLDSASQKGKIKLDPAQRKPFDDEFKALDVMNYNSIKAYVKAHPSSVAVAAIVKDRFIDYPYPQQATEMYALFSPEVKKSFYGKAINASLAINNRTAPGKLAPDFTMNDVTGKPLKLSELRGKYVLVDFWASWCGPCRKENPNVVAAYKKFHDKGFEILGVSLDNKKENWLKAIQDDGLTWKHVSDLKGWSNTAAAAYGVKSVPASFLLDQNGKVVAKDLRGEELTNKLSEIFKN